MLAVKDIDFFEGSSYHSKTLLVFEHSPDLQCDNIAETLIWNKFTILDTNVKGDLVSDSTRWYKVEYDGTILYVHSSFATINVNIGQVIATLT